MNISDQAADALPQCIGTSSNSKIMHRLSPTSQILQQVLQSRSTSSSSLRSDSTGRLRYRTSAIWDHDCFHYVGFSLPQLDASTTWALGRFRYIRPRSLPLCETCVRFSYVVFASAMWNLGFLCYVGSWSPRLWDHRRVLVHFSTSRLCPACSHPSSGSRVY